MSSALPPKNGRQFSTPQGNATVSLQTKKIKGLHENDFIMATKIDRIRSDGHGVNELWLSCNLRPFSTPSAFFDVQQIDAAMR